MPAEVEQLMVRTTTAVDLRGLERPSSRPGPVQAVRKVDIGVPTGETIALLGPNGAGKSTAIDMLLGLQRPDAGSVAVFGESPEQAVDEGRIGVMLQTGGVLRELTVRELVAMIAALFPKPLDVEDTLALAGIEAIAERRTERLSGGETQRLRFAVALVSDPDLLVLDEPTVGMDVEGRHAFWTTVRELSGQGKMILFATHYLEEADAHADRVVLMAKGTSSPTARRRRSRQWSARGRSGRRSPASRSSGSITCRASLGPSGEAVVLVATDSDTALRALLETFSKARGHRLTSDSIGPAMGGTSALFALLGGVWFSITSGVMHTVAEALPSYWLVQAAHVGLGGAGWGRTGWAVVAVWSVATAVAAGRAYRRDIERV